MNVLTTEANWAWPVALSQIFRPCGANLMIARSTDEFLSIIRTRTIHTTIVDMDAELAPGLATVRLIQRDFPRIPNILLSSRPGHDLFEKALTLGVFSVIDKPVDMDVLQDQLNRLFVKRYGMHVFKRKS